MVLVFKRVVKKYLVKTMQYLHKKTITTITKSLSRHNNQKPVSFMSIGDWGGYILGGYHQQNIIDIANTTIYPLTTVG
jgi:hypothetical protein